MSTTTPAPPLTFVEYDNAHGRIRSSGGTAAASARWWSSRCASSVCGSSPDSSSGESHCGSGRGGT
eukprot:71904-Chlamydomonas_euryale.AAC.1